MKRVLAVFAATMLALAAADLEAVKSERDPEKRSERALDFAVKTLSSARQSYSEGEYRKALESVGDIGASVDLAYDSLKASGKEARKSKYFKRAELRLRELSRHLDEFAKEVAVDDRPPIEKVNERAHAVRDEILSGILEKK
jgi:hypothetical protein